MAKATVMLQQAGKSSEVAAALLYGQLAAGRLIARAKTIRTEYPGRKMTVHSDWPVPAMVWNSYSPPPLGHVFWTVGDVQFQPPSRLDDLSLDPILPTVTIRGARASRDGLLVICRELRPAKGRGRRKGVGGYAKYDIPLVLEMHRLLTEGLVASLHAAAAELAPKARGESEFESKVRRLMHRYRDTFPNAHIN